MNTLLMENELKRILIINLGGIGDILLSLPALSALNSRFPNSELDLLISKRISEIAVCIPHFRKIYPFYVNSRDGVLLLGAIHNLFTLSKLKNRRYDLAINMRTIASKQGASKIKFLLGTIKPKLTLGRDTDGMGYFFDIKVPEPIVGLKPETEYDFDTIRALGVESVSKDFNLNICADDSLKIGLLLKNNGVCESDTLIGIHPGGMPSRRWPVERFAQVINSVSAKVNAKFVVTGDKDDLILAKKLQELVNVVLIDFTGRLSIMDLLILIKKCRCFVSNDTGPMHMAEVLKVPLVAIFGSGDFLRYDPRNIDPRAQVFYNKQACAPCNKRDCDSMKCFEAIAPEDVASGVLKIIGIS